MNPKSLDLRERRVLAVGLLVALVLLVSMALVMPYIARVNHYLLAIEGQSFRLERLGAIAAQLPALEGELAVAREQAIDQSHVLQQSTPSLAAAQVQELLTQRVAIHGGSIQSTQVRAPVVTGELKRISVGISMSATNAELADLFHDLETRRPFLFLDDVQIRAARQHRGARADRGEMDVQFVVYAYMPGAVQ